VLSSEDNPVLLGSEENDVNGNVDLSLSKAVSADEVPHNHNTVLAGGGQVRALGGHSDGVNLSLVANEGVLKSHGCVIPNLDSLVPRGRNNEGGLGILEELNSGNPIVVSALLDGEFALTNGVPDLEVLVSATGGNLSVLRAESDGEDVSGVADESLDC